MAAATAILRATPAIPDADKPVWKQDVLPTDLQFRNVARVPGYPILGVLPQLLKKGLYNTIKEFFDAARESGIAYSKIGLVPMVVARDAAVIRQLLVDNADSLTRLGPEGKGPFNVADRIGGPWPLT